MGFRNGLKKVGHFWHYAFSFQGRTFNGSTRCQDKEAAKLWLKTYRDQIAKQAMGVEPEPEIPTLGAALALWVKTHKGVKSAGHVQGTETAIRLHFHDYLETRLDLLSTRDVENAVKAYLGAKGHTAGGVAYILRALKTIYGWYGRRDRQFKAKGRPWEVAPPTIKRKARVYLTIKLMGPFLKALEQVVLERRARFDVVEICRLMMGTGVRESEAIKARVEHLDLRRRRFTPVDTKGGEAEEIPIPKWALPHLKALVKGRTEGILIPTRLGGVHKRAYTLPFVREAGERIGLKGLTPHRLRSTFGTLLLKEGVSLRDIQKAYRHVSINTTIEYLEWNFEDLERGLNRIGKKAGLEYDLNRKPKARKSR